MPDDDRRLVWDLPLRMFHWLLALSIFLCWGTAKAGFGWMKWHFFLGYWVTGLLIFRLIWGFLGPRHARFSSFLKGPGSVIAYTRTLARTGAGYRTAGHNPLGALMVILMLLLVTLQAATGLFSTDDIAWSGPYNPSVSGAIASQLTRIHHLNFNLIWGAIGLHLAAIIYYTAFKKEPLIHAMWTGKKRVAAIPDGEWIHGSALLRAVGVVAVSSFVVYLILHGAPAPAPLE